MKPNGVTKHRGRYTATLDGRVLGTYGQMAPALAVYARALKRKATT